MATGQNDVAVAASMMTTNMVNTKGDVQPPVAMTAIVVTTRSTVMAASPLPRQTRCTLARPAWAPRTTAQITVRDPTLLMSDEPRASPTAIAPHRNALTSPLRRHGSKR